MRKKLIFTFQNFKNCYWNGKDQSAVRDFSLPDILNRREKNCSFPFSTRAYFLTSCCPILISKESSESLKKLLPQSSRFRSRENAPRTSRLQVTLSVNHMSFQHQVIKTFKSCHFTFLSLFCDCLLAFSKNWNDTLESRNWLYIIHGVIKDVFDGEICPQNSWLWYQ